MRLLVLLVLLVSCASPGRHVRPWDLDTSRGDSLAWARNDRVIKGNLIIKGTDLERVDLPNLRSIEGDLQITFNDELLDLDLRSLQRVAGRVGIGGNRRLATVSGLASLQHVGGGLAFMENGALTNLDGLSKVTRIGRDLTIYGNPELADLDGLSSLEVVGQDAIILDNDRLPTCAARALSARIQIKGTLDIRGNRDPAACSGPLGRRSD